MKKKNKSQLKDAIIYLKSAKKPIFFTTLLFFLTTIVGYLNADSLTEILTPFLKDLIGKTENLGPLELILFIFQNNAITSFLALALGIFLGIFPLITTVTNGVVLGYVIERTAQLASFFELWRLFPHGIFELPAVFISLGLGIKLGYLAPINYLKYYWNKDKKLVWLPFIIALPLIALIPLALTSNALNKETFSPELLIPSAFILALFYFSATMILFLLFTAVTNKELRKIQLKTLKSSIYGSIKVFFYIIIPLLIIAAIIEGTLISII